MGEREREVDEQSVERNGRPGRWLGPLLAFVTGWLAGRGIQRTIVERREDALRRELLEAEDREDHPEGSQ
jgi:hypothetical protein